MNCKNVKKNTFFTFIYINFNMILYNIYIIMLMLKVFSVFYKKNNKKM